MSQSQEYDNVPAQSINLSATWNINQYEVTYKSADGSNRTSTVSYNYNTSLPNKIFTRTGYTFVKWVYDSNSQDITNNTLPANDITVKAIWEINKYNVTFMPNGANGNPNNVTLNLTYDTDLPVATATNINFTRSGYRFVRWVNIANNSNINTVPGNNVTVKAIWIEQYTVTFKAGTRSGNTISLRLDYGSDLPNYNDSRINYVAGSQTFIGWFNTSNNQYSTVPRSNITLIADWEGGSTRIFGPVFRNLLN